MSPVPLSWMGRARLRSPTTTPPTPPRPCSAPSRSNGATDFPVGSNLTVTFSEPVNVTPPWFTLTCSLERQRGAPASAAARRPSRSIRRVTLVDGETCTLTVLAGQVSDQDGNDPPDNMVVDFVVGFTAFDVCVAPYTPIHSIQGSGLTAADHRHRHDQGRRRRRLRGHAPPPPASTSRTSSATATRPRRTASSCSPAAPTASASARWCASPGSPASASTRRRSTARTATPPPCRPRTSSSAAPDRVAPTDVTLPFAERRRPRAVRGHARALPAAAGDRRVLQLRPLRRDRPRPAARRARPARSRGTAIDEPGAAANARTAGEHACSRITLDDAQSAQNPPVAAPPERPAVLADEPLPRRRHGRRTPSACSGYDFSLYRIFPTGPADYTAVNPRPAAPEPVGGDRPRRRDEHAQLLRHRRLPDAATRSTTSAARSTTSSAAAGTATSRRVHPPARQAPRGAVGPRRRRHRPQRARELHRRRAAREHRRPACPATPTSTPARSAPTRSRSA